MKELDQLLSYFQGRNLPETKFTISKWASTSNLQKCVNLAIATAQDGNKASIQTLRLIRDRLETVQQK